MREEGLDSHICVSKILTALCYSLFSRICNAKHRALEHSDFTYFREYNGPVIVASPDGGVDIEEVAEKTPERIMKLPVDIKTGYFNILSLKRIIYEKL